MTTVMAMPIFLASWWETVISWLASLREDRHG